MIGGMLCQSININMTQNKRLLYLIEYLLAEGSQNSNIKIPENREDRFRLFRSLVNVRPPKPVSGSFLSVQNEFLRYEISQKGITDVTSLTEVNNNIYLRFGDITTLKCGAVVNAANSGMTGCYYPCHTCIDNAIHTFSGVQLRMECADIMERQGFAEPVGGAKVTKAYNLPCDYVIHTVGPIVSGQLTERHCKQLESCYKSCLEAAMKNKIDSIAFCCISTGEFHFPNYEAAIIAVKTVKEFQIKNKIKVIFNVFKESDLQIYRNLLRQYKKTEK